MIDVESIGKMELRRNKRFRTSETKVKLNMAIYKLSNIV